MKMKDHEEKKNLTGKDKSQDDLVDGEEQRGSKRERKARSISTLDEMTNVKAEIQRVRGEIEQQKRLIKKSVKKGLVVETAETEMKALHTRLGQSGRMIRRLPTSR